jgi:hypothetical protein
MDFFGYFNSDSKDTKKSGTKKDCGSKNGKSNQKKQNTQCGG